MSEQARRIAEHPWFGRIVTIAILVAGVVVGLQTDAGIVARYGRVLDAIDLTILVIFGIEAAVKLAAYGWRYFTDPWNVFDLSILTVALLPFDTKYVAVLRLARLLRFLRLVRALPKLQILVGALLKSIPSMGYVGMLLGILFYVYAVAAVFMFGHNDPVHFGSLPIAFVSLFRVVTGDAWTDLMYTQMYSCTGFGYGDTPELCTQPQAQPVLGAVFFCSFVLIGAMVILNLFIGVIMNGMEEARLENQEREKELRGDGAPNAVEEADAVAQEITALADRVDLLRRLLREQQREELRSQPPAA
jgi:voltage-gated sodium channel